MTQKEALGEAVRLYDRLYRDLRAETSESGLGALDASFRDGQTTLETLALTATDLPLAADTHEMVASYLEGPAEDDLEARRAWMALLPELFVDLRRAEEAEHATLMQSLVPAFENAVVTDQWADVAAALSEFEWDAGDWVSAFDVPERRRFVEYPDVESDLHVDWIDIVGDERGADGTSGDEAHDETRPNMSYALAA